MKIKILFIFILACVSNSLFAGKADNLIHIETSDLSLVMSVNEDEALLFKYLGAKINDIQPFAKNNSYRRVDYGTDRMVYPASGGRSFVEPALRVTHSNGDINTELIYLQHKETKLRDSNVHQTEINLRDRNLPLFVDIVLTAYQKENVITQSVKIRNKDPKTVVLHSFYSGYLPLRAQKYYLNSFYGSWAKEMYMEETLLTHGMKSIQNRKGVRTTHTENPSFLLSLDMPLTENAGNVIAGALAWSGNYKLNFELDEFNNLNISAGINPFASEYYLKTGEQFHTPEWIFTYSTTGAGGASRNLHDWARNYAVYDSKSIRPTLLNSWEGAYFDFDEKTLIDMIDDAQSLGLELFVLDDGWFGNKYPRNNSHSGLGDWQVNKKKLPSGIAKIADYAASKGLQFGIWIEPEMVNPESELAKKHPEWIVQSKGRAITTIRNQLLLDLTNPDVLNFVFEVFDNLMKQSANITYIKWDANRHVESAGSTYLPDEEQSHFWIKYTQGLYAVYERIRKKYPDVIIQACSSGGGRLDFGSLKYHQEVWTSDNTDAKSRIFIQYGTNMIYPALISGAHVSASPNHQTNNQTPLKFRFDLAMSGRLGMELQPKDMNAEELAFSKKAIQNYKNIREIIMYGDLYRVISPYEGNGYYSILYVSKDKKQAVLFEYCFEFQGRVGTPILKLNGLDRNSTYKLTELNVENSIFWGNNMSFSGEYLINEGINPLLQKCYDSAVFLIELENQ